MFRDDVMTVYLYIEVHHPSLQGTCSQFRKSGCVATVYIIRVCKVRAAYGLHTPDGCQVYIIRVCKVRAASAIGATPICRVYIIRVCKVHTAISDYG